MKINRNKDFDSTLNLPKETISIISDLIKKEKYFLNSIQDYKKYNNAIEKNKLNGKNYNLASIPFEINDKSTPTQLINSIYKDIYIRHQIMMGNIITHHISFIEKGSTNNEKVNGLKLKEQVKYKNIKEDELKDTTKNIIHEIKKMGVVSNYNNNIESSFDENTEERVVENFFKSYKNGNIYKQIRPVHWCTKCKSEISQSDVIIQKARKNNVYIKYRIKNCGEIYEAINPNEEMYFIVATIRPWVLESSDSIVACKNMEYSIVNVTENNKSIYYIIASECVDTVMENAFFLRYNIIKKIDASKLQNIICYNPLDENREVKLIYSTREKIMINDNDFTGINVVSNTHTYIDYLIELENNIDNLKSIIDGEGNVYPSTIKFNGKFYKDVQKDVVDYLKEKGLILSVMPITTSINKCSTCKTELVYKIANEWYIKRDNEVKDELKNAISNIKNVLKIQDNSLKNNVFDMLDKISLKDELKISVNKKIGIPIPMFFCADCGKYLSGDKYFEIIRDCIGKNGISSLYNMTPDQILGKEIVCECGSNFFFKDDGVFNNTFILSSMQFLSKSEQQKSDANICIASSKEFLKQVYSLSYNKTGVENLSKLDLILVHSGINENIKIVTIPIFFDKYDENSLSDLITQNIGINDVVKKYSTDVLRLWAMSVFNENNVKLEEQDIVKINSDYLNIRRCLKYILSNLYDFIPVRNYIEINDRTDLDKYIYTKLYDLNVNIDLWYEDGMYNKVYKEVFNFCKNFLTRDYFSTLKYRLYILSEDDKIRRSTQSTLHDILNALVLWLSPVIPFTIEEIWPFVWNKNNDEQINVLMYRNELKEYDFRDVIDKWDKIFDFKRKITRYIENAKKDKVIENTFQANVLLQTTPKSVEFINDNKDEIVRALNISEIEAEESNKRSVKITKTTAQMCPRCRNYTDSIGKLLEYRYLCEDCAKILVSKKS